MTSLLTNNAAMTALTTLKSISLSLDTTSNRVSTGQRVSAASDNAAYWSIATTVRTDNASLSAVKDSLGLGSSAVDTAYNGVNNIITSLQNLRTKLQTALQPGVDRSKVQTEIAAIQNQMKSVADSSVSSGQNWLSVNSSESGYTDIRSVVAGFSRDKTGNINFSTVNVSTAAIRLYDAGTGGTQATTALSVGSAPVPATIDFSGAADASFTIKAGGAGGTANTITLTKATLTSAVANIASVTRQEFVNAINNQIAASANNAGKVRASLDGSGRLVFESTATGATNAKLDLTMGASATVNFGYGAASTVMTQVVGADASAGAAGGILDSGTAGNSIATLYVYNASGAADDASIKVAINRVEAAIAKVTDAGTKLGANKTQIDGQKSFIDTLMKVNDRTIGTLVDADIEEESTRLKALQTQQQLAVQALSIANSASQNVLSLFK
ncbi:flagellin [Methylobacterium sp. 174MFSha1.1]|uniref:flagellin N-terminal helical domain-containing protein n=1 Tax=Methylobacterium sp. 174MFSha1.1 TaxID=1502749 RepID=UPI0008E0AF00|nr:flagellin [Methylobacterium sp. 174MFSha1.1]SFV16110.1 flagellin [Methylobacterium sp. 174MFSha1.1]